MVSGTGVPGGVKTLLLVAADAMEFAGLDTHTTVYRHLDWDVDYSAEARIHDNRCYLVANGAGPRLARQAAERAREKTSLDVLVSYGFCGALNRRLRPGDVFLASVLADPATGVRMDLASPAKTPRAATGELVSVDHVAGDAEEKDRLRSLGYDAVEMEAAGLAECAREWRIPFCCLRVVTDTADENFSLELNRARDDDGRIRKWKIVAGALRSPYRGLPELVRLRRRSRQGAARLGDFFANCRF